MSSGDLQCTTYGIILFRQGNRIDILSGGKPTLFCELSKAQATAGHHEAALTFLYKKKVKCFQYLTNERCQPSGLHIHLHMYYRRVDD